MEVIEPPSHKQIKFKSTNKAINSSPSLNNLSGDITFKNLKQIAHIICNTKNQKVLFFYEDSEIEINEESATINEIFEGIDEITIEIKLKETMNNMNNLSKENIGSYKNFSTCIKHDKEYAKTFCQLCKRNLCFRCSITIEHKTHKYDMIISEFQNKSKHLEEKFSNVSKLLKTGNGYTKESLNILKSSHIFKITSDYDVLFQKIDEIRNFYHDFYENYFGQMDKSLSTLQEDFRKLTIKYNSFSGNTRKSLLNNDLIRKENSNTSINGYINSLPSSSTNVNGISSLIATPANVTEIFKNLENFEKDLNSFLRGFKIYSEFKEILSVFDDDYENHKNSMNHKLDMIKSEFIKESNLQKYDKLIQSENEVNLIKIYLETFVEDYNKNHSRMCMPIPLTKSLIQFDFEWDEFSKISIGKHNYTFGFKKNSNFINIKDFLFISGGLENLNTNLEKSSQKCYFLSIAEDRILELADMVKSRSSHSLVYNEKLKIIYAISGYDNSSVEIYLPNRNRWFLFKPLNKWRCHANVLFADDNKYMYVFGGKSDESECISEKNPFNSIERISIENLKNILLNNYFKFESLENMREIFENDVINLKHSVEGHKINLNFHTYGSGVIQLNENKFMVLGGECVGNGFNLNDEIKIFQHEDDDSKSDKVCLTITDFINSDNKVVKLPDNFFFFNQNFLTVGDNLLAQFNQKGDLIIYNKDSQKIEIKKNDVEN